ncbi:MAG: permease [Firmicutes bacterium]|nr:permease [Bacillota bacterium]
MQPRLRQGNQITRTAAEKGAVKIGIIAFLASLALLLLTLVEMRRGFLFPTEAYLKIGSPSAIILFDPRHLPMLLLAALGACFSYLYLVKAERRAAGAGAQLQSFTRPTAAAIVIMLVIDLFTYRVVPASRIAAAGRTGIGRAFPIEAFPAWLAPLGETLNYFLLVWHATLIGLLLGALFLVASGRLLEVLRRGGARAHLAAGGLALTQPFCSCCAAPIGSALFRAGAPLGSTLAFVVSSPMLNLTSLTLAALLLPGKYAVLRIAGGLAVGLLLTYLAALAAGRPSSDSSDTSGIPGTGRAGDELRGAAAPGEAHSGATPFGRIAFTLNRLAMAPARWMALDALTGRALPSPTVLITTWLSTAWRLAAIVLPLLFAGSLAASVLVRLIPPSGNNPVGIILAAAFGTLLMIPTWTEIPIALGLLGAGLTGPAAAVLITLPAVSVPCLLVIGSGTRRPRAAVALGILVFLAGTAAGLSFLGA